MADGPTGRDACTCAICQSVFFLKGQCLLCFLHENKLHRVKRACVINNPSAFSLARVQVEMGKQDAFQKREEMGESCEFISRPCVRPLRESTIQLSQFVSSESCTDVVYKVDVGEQKTASD